MGGKDNLNLLSLGESLKSSNQKLLICVMLRCFGLFNSINN